MSEVDPATEAAAAYAEDRGDWLGRCAYLLTRDRDRALDLVQDTLLQAWRARELVDGAEDRDRYVLRIMLNLHRGQFRKKGLPTSLLEHDQLATHDDVSSRVGDADLVSRALAALSPRQQAVVVLRYWADMDDVEIAQILDCRRSTVRSLVARSLARLRRDLETS